VLGYISVIPATQEAEIGRIKVQGQKKKKKTHYQDHISTVKLAIVACACAPSHVEDVARTGGPSWPQANHKTLS
jgi:ABC-type nickel/cobalt efflux system permease component RcnA